MKLKWAILVGLAVMITFLPGTSLGQEQEPAPERKVVFEPYGVMQGPVGTHLPRIGQDTFVFVASEMGFDAKSVKGAPYSAEATTEAIQTLSDGNRIVRKSSAAVYRDSEGRTRREQTLAAIGPFATAGEPPKTIHINDPVAGVSYMLDPNTRIARKMQPMQYSRRIASSSGTGTGVVAFRSSGGVTVQSEGKTPSKEGKTVTSGSAVFTHRLSHPGPDQGPVVLWHAKKGTKVNTEPLGSQIIEGVTAEGTRQTSVIPAGEIGNERPIEVVSERWFSPELKTVVLTIHRDPRFGETIYRLTNINRSEPDPSLFEVPGDYAVKDAAVRVQKYQVEKPANKQ
ncbi:MAG TPA: hypothetical protein VMM84_11225 [Pyrinomonadaceae bacterium]|nr:hypothetical protein [Pyrinomonadaceae bacterium]